MRFVTAELQAKIDNDTATENEKVVHKLLSVLSETDDLTPEEAHQKILQADAVCDAKDKGHHDTAEALLELFSTESAQVRRTERGFEFKLTDKGMAQAASLITRMAGKLN